MASDDDASARETHAVELDARVYEHVQAMGMPDESASDTLARLLGLTPDPATVGGDELSTPLPEDPPVPDALAPDPTAEVERVDPDEIPEPATAPADDDASLGELAAILDDDALAQIETLLEEIDEADAESLEDVVADLDGDGRD